MFDEKYYLSLIRNQPINYNGLILHVIPLKVIGDYGLDRYDELIFPFAVTPSCFKTPVASILRDVILKDLRLLTSFNEMLQMTTHWTLCKPTPEYIDLTLPTGGVFRIDDSNFDDICDIILKMNAKSKINVIKEPEHKGRKKDIWKKLTEGRKRFEERNRVHLYDMLNVCEFGGEYHIPMSEIDEWSLWKISSCYGTRIGWKSYNDALDIALVTGESKNISGDNHWLKKFMIRE